MRYGLISKMLILLLTHQGFLLASSADSDHSTSCHKPKQGPAGLTGPTGPQGSTGPAITSSYVSANGAAQTQTIMSRPVSFDLPDIAKLNIIHPAGPPPDNSAFKIVNTGIYLIGWNVSLANFTTSEQVFIGVDLNFSLVPSTRELVNLVTPFFSVISGQTILPLAAGDIIQLQITHFTSSTIEVENPSFIITQIAGP